MLFVKYLSDFYKEKLQELEKKYKGDKKRIERALRREKFKLDVIINLPQNRNKSLT